MYDKTGREWTGDTRVTAIDRPAIVAFAGRAIEEGFQVTIYITRRGVWYVVVPGVYLDALSVEESNRWAFAVVSYQYLAGVVVPRHLAPLEAAAPVQTAAPVDDAPAELGEEFQKWEL